MARQTTKSVLYLVVNGYVSCLVWAALLALVLLSALLCLLCGLGWLLFRQLFRVGVVELFAACDAVMANFIASANEQIQLEPPDLPVASTSQYELLDDLWDISPQGLRVLLYLLTVKFALGVLGLFLLLLELWIAQIVAQDLRVASTKPQVATHWLLLCARLLLLAAAFLLMLKGLHRFACYCGAATRLFICRRMR